MPMEIFVDVMLDPVKLLLSLATSLSMVDLFLDKNLWRSDVVFNISLHEIIINSLTMLYNTPLLKCQTVREHCSMLLAYHSRYLYLNETSNLVKSSLLQ